MQAIVEWEYVAVDPTDVEPPEPGLVVADVTCVATTDDGAMRMFNKRYVMRQETCDTLREMIARGVRP